MLGLRWLALGIVPMTWIEVLVGATLGKRKMEAQVLVKDGFVPIATAALALPLYWLGMRVNGKAGGDGEVVVSDRRGERRHELGPRQERSESMEPEPSRGSGS